MVEACTNDQFGKDLEGTSGNGKVSLTERQPISGSVVEGDVRNEHPIL